jgi:N-acetylmuramoyl-L-alanine amidase
MNGLEALVIGAAIFAGASNPPNVQYDESTTCLAKNMYYEARNQGTAGWMAVTAVVLNRVNDDRFPNTICGVVQQGPTRASWKDPKVRIPIKHRCQFSWFCDGKSDKPKDKTTYNKMLSLSDSILSNELPFYDITDGATHYHADYVMPAWAKTKTRTVEIQDHIFYKWKR